MQKALISLNCPSCSSPGMVDRTKLQFGYQFTCENCGTKSMLIMNNKLYMISPGEKICVECGRVGDKDDRICQCGASLTKTCISKDCHKEISVDNIRCGNCGWPQDVDPRSFDGYIVRFMLLKKGILNPNENTVRAFCGKILDNFRRVKEYKSRANNNSVLINNEEFDKLKTALEDIVSELMEKADEDLEWDTLKVIYNTLGIIDAESGRSADILIKHLKNFIENDERVKVICEAIQALGPNAKTVSLDIITIIEKYIEDSHLVNIEQLCNTLISINPGNDVIGSSLFSLIDINTENEIIFNNLYKVIISDKSNLENLTSNLLRIFKNNPNNQNIVIKISDTLIEMGSEANITVDNLIRIFEIEINNELVVIRICKILSSIGKEAKKSYKILRKAYRLYYRKKSINTIDIIAHTLSDIDSDIGIVNKIFY